MKIHCSGIGGIGLSAYAALRRAEGHAVGGSDRSDSALLDDLRSQGIAITLNQDGSAVTSDLDLFVYSEAIPVDAPERVKAKELGIKSMSYFEALGELSKSFKVIAVCGTHGKSSTTAMVARLFIEAELDPSVVVGTKSADLGGRNWRKGNSEWFIVEACEYRRDFLFLAPSIILMTNVDGDHYDAFHGKENYQQAFTDFLKLLPSSGTVITHGSDADCLRIANESGRTVIDADSEPLIDMHVPGLHMRQNAQLALALAKNLGIDNAPDMLKGFGGTWRRMEVKGTMKNGITVIDDYAHHPIEIKATLSAMKEVYPEKRIVCVFQPHTHERTLSFYDDFTRCFSEADLVVIPNVYNARSDIEKDEVDVEKFISDIREHSNVECVHGENLEKTFAMLTSDILKPNDVVITMGAGDITKLSDQLLEA